MSARVDTQLSQHLIEQGLLSADALEDALQKQLAHGGALDTILLETGELDEARLSEALSSAWGTGALSVDRLIKPDTHAAAKLPARMAQSLRICPVFQDDNGLHVATRGPLDQQLIDEVAAMIGAALVPHVVPEVRLAQALTSAYSVAPDERMISLLTRLELSRTGKALDSLPIEDDRALAIAALEREDTPTEDWDLVEALAHLVAQESRAGISEVVVSYSRRFLPFTAVFGVRDQMAIGWKRSGPCEGAQFELPLPIPEESILGHVLENPSPFIGKPPLADGNSVVFGWLGRRRPWTVLLIPIVVAGRTVGALYGDGGVRSRDFESLSDLVAFGARIGPAFEALLRARHRLHKPERGDGRDGTSPFARGYVAPSQAELDAVEADDGADQHPQWTAAPEVVVATAPPPVQAMPSSLTAAPATETDVTFEIVAGESDDGFDDEMDIEFDIEDEGMDVLADAEPPLEEEDDGEPRSVEEALAHAAAIADASAQAFLAEDDTLPAITGDILEPELSVIHKLPASLVGGSSDEPQLEAADVDGDDGSLPEPWARLREVAPSDEPLPELLRSDGWEDISLEDAYLSPVDDDEDRTRGDRVEPSTAPPISASEWIERLYSRKTEIAARSIDALVAFGEEALPALERAFPGRLRLDPFAAGPEPVAALQLGPLVEVLARMGNAGLRVAANHIESRSRTKRYVATFLYLNSGDESCIRFLRPRLHDAEPRIQGLAARVLGRFIASPDFEPEVLAHLRARLDSPVYDARERAIRLLGLFRDPRAVPTLIQQLEDKDGELETQALRALRTISLRDLGTRPRPWRRWWNKAKHRPRIEWLLDGLRSKAEDLRVASRRELVELTGDDYGYDAAAKKGAREKAAGQFDDWWQQQREELMGDQA